MPADAVQPPALVVLTGASGFLAKHVAQALLREGRPVKAVADACGYSSASALARVFRAHLGMAPRDWLTAQT